MKQAFHVCTETSGAPDKTAEVPEGTRWVCECGSNFVYREGFSMSGHRSLSWWPAPALPVQRRERSSLRELLIRPRRG